MKYTILTLAVAALLSSCASKGTIDQLMGKGPKQSEFSMQVSDHLQDISHGQPYTETSPYIAYGGGIPGGSPACVSHYTGHARRYDYNYRPNSLLGFRVGKKTPYHFVTREMAFGDGTGCWQGGNPPLGFYDNRWNAKLTVW